MFQPHIFQTDISEKHLACCSEDPSSTTGILYILWHIMPVGPNPACLIVSIPCHLFLGITNMRRIPCFRPCVQGHPSKDTPDDLLLLGPQFSPRSMTEHSASIEVYFSCCQKRVLPLFLPPKPSHMA